MKYLNETGLGYFWQKIKTYVIELLTSKVDKVQGKGLSTNDYTTAEKEKLAGLQNVVVEDSLESISTNNALSAKQGWELNQKINLKSNTITAYGSTNQTVTNTTTINLDSSVSVGDRLLLLDNQIIIGAGISKVKISGAIFYQDFPSSQAYLWGRIFRNGKSIIGSLMGKGNTFFQSCIFSPTLIEVAEGDKITLNSGDVCNNTVTIRAGSAHTYITVEVVD